MEGGQEREREREEEKKGKKGKEDLFFVFPPLTIEGGAFPKAKGTRERES